jgi:hypothetical protein
MGVGIATGLAVVGDLIGSGAARAVDDLIPIKGSSASVSTIRLSYCARAADFRMLVMSRIRHLSHDQAARTGPASMSWKCEGSDNVG